MPFDYLGDFETSNDTIDRSAQNCGLNAREKCLEPIKKHWSVKHISYGKNENELSETCKKLFKVIACLDKYLDDCKTISGRIRVKVESLSSGHRSLTNELCDDSSPMRQSFSECIEHNTKDTIQCFKNYEKEMLDTMSEMSFQSQKFGYIQMDSICCALDRHNICTRLLLETRCNTSAADLSEQLFQLSHSDITSHCLRGRIARHCNSCEINFINVYIILFSLVFIAFIAFL